MWELPLNKEVEAIKTREYVHHQKQNSSSYQQDPFAMSLIVVSISN